MTTNKLAIIGGSGLYDVEEFKDRELLDLNTPWGKPSDQILKTNYNNKEIYFLPRHGRGHFISPSNINFRANIDALKQVGVTDIVSVSAVGSLKEGLPPGKDPEQSGRREEDRHSVCWPVGSYRHRGSLRLGRPATVWQAHLVPQR